MAELDLLSVSDNVADAPAFYSGTGTSSLVPGVFPVAINGRPYMIDQNSGEFTSGFEERIRESVDQETEPGESTINPQGLWRRGSNSWHVGAGQEYGDTASQPYRFWKSKGVNPWTKGELRLHKDTKVSLSSNGTKLPLVVVGSNLYVGDGQALKYSSNPFASSPTWNTVTAPTVSGSPLAADIEALATDGTSVYVSYNNNGIFKATAGSTSAPTAYYPTSGSSAFTYQALAYAKGRLVAAHDNQIHFPPVSGSGHTAFFTQDNSAFRFVGFAGGQNAIYAAGYAGNTSLIYKITIKTDGTLDVPVVALELPTGEIVSSIFAYVGFVLIGTNKGVRFCSPDSQNNLIAGPIIPTTDSVKGFTAEDRFVWYGYTNYDGVSTGLGRLDLSTFTNTNAPAYATDLMRTSTAAVLDVETISSKRVFSVSGVGVVVEDADKYVPSGNIELGRFRWGIPDRKFVAKVDVRTQPLVGTVSVATALDNGNYVNSGSQDTAGSIESTFDGPEDRAIEASFKVTLESPSGNASTPVLTRFSSRAYVTPARSEQFIIPVLLHQQIDIWDQTYTLDVNNEKAVLRDLIRNPRTINLQIGYESHTVVAENMRWVPVDAVNSTWVWDGTAIITFRSIQE